jgi:hypothetical protein
MSLSKWVCPQCKIVVEAIAVEVAHRCPAKKNQIVAFRPETKKEE